MLAANIGAGAQWKSHKYRKTPVELTHKHINPLIILRLKGQHGFPYNNSTRKMIAKEGGNESRKGGKQKEL